MLRTIVLFAAFSLSIFCHKALAQQQTPTPDRSTSGNQLMNLLDNEAPEKDYTMATFKATRLMNGHSIENVGAGVLDFRIAHRFNTVRSGINNFFGLDGAVTRLGLDYGVTDWLMLGVGRSTHMKEIDGLVKTKILRQTTDNSMPVSLSYLGTIGVITGPQTVPTGTEYYFSNRMAFSNTLLIARKFSETFSVQLMPTHVHYNIVPLSTDPNDVLAFGVGGRIKLSRRVSFNAEYYYQMPFAKIGNNVNSLAIGFDIETGGHVFQLHFTNSAGMTQPTFVGQTTDKWGNGDIRFGFNISRVFTIVKPKEFR